MPPHIFSISQTAGSHVITCMKPCCRAPDIVITCDKRRIFLHSWILTASVIYATSSCLDRAAYELHDNRRPSLVLVGDGKTSSTFASKALTLDILEFVSNARRQQMPGFTHVHWRPPHAACNQPACGRR